MALERREARLKAEFASLYRGVPAGIWVPVADVLDGVTACRLLTGRHSGDFMRGRPLDERHFEFRGGRVGGGESHTRVTDA